MDDDESRNPARRISSCPELRDIGATLRPVPVPTHHDRQKSLMLPGSQPIQPASTPPSDDGLDITDAHPHTTPALRKEVSIPPLASTPRRTTPSLRSIASGPEQDIPAPSWDDYPPLPTANPGPIWHWRFWWSWFRRLFGYEGSVDHKENMSLFWKVLFNLTQAAVAIILLVLSSHIPSPTDPTVSERVACEKPLAAWTYVGIVRLCLSCGRNIWATRRQKLARYLKAHSPRSDDVEAASADATAARLPQPATPTPPSSQQSHEPTSPPSSPSPPLPHALLFSRLSISLLLFSIAWWFVAQVLLYTNPGCRLSSPHTWWLLFALVSVQYIILAELVLFAILVFIVVPLALLIINSVLLCLNRTPIQPPTRINPEIGKLPKDTVARIPLVLYIPHPHKSWKPRTEDILPHSYPPKTASISSKEQFSPTSLRLPKWMPFKGFTSRKQDDEWESQWETGLYPFVRLAGSRATCNICLEEFQEPRRRTAAVRKSLTESVEATSKTKTNESKKRHLPLNMRLFNSIHSVKSARVDSLKLEGAGEGAQPLRLLECGHVFHRDCIDPWLTDVSGRCPVCQRAVELDGSQTNTAPPG